MNRIVQLIYFVALIEFTFTQESNQVPSPKNITKNFPIDSQFKKTSLQTGNISTAIPQTDQLLDCCYPRPSSCADIQGFYKTRKSGIYAIYPKRKLDSLPYGIEVYCDLETNGGEWTVIQRRDDYGLPREEFRRNWYDYKNGFGNLSREFWLGNDKIYALTSQEDVVLRIDMESLENEKRYAEYDYFFIRREEQKYQISFTNFRGDAGDSLSKHKNMYFSTYDSDNDKYSTSCAAKFKGSWWYKGCHDSNLNGMYYLGTHSTFADGVNWYTWKGYYYSLKRVEMKIRPI